MIPFDFSYQLILFLDSFLHLLLFVLILQQINYIFKQFLLIHVRRVVPDKLLLLFDLFISLLDHGPKRFYLLFDLLLRLIEIGKFLFSFLFLHRFLRLIRY